MNYTKILIIAVFVIGLSSKSHAETEDKQSWIGKLASNEPNYFVLADSFDNDTLQEDLHLEFYLSIQYPLAFPVRRILGEYGRWAPPALFFIYNGTYDFYMFETDRYESAPVISRRQNPGLAFEWGLEPNRKLRLGWFHESNGQSIDSGSDSNNNGVDDGTEEFALEQADGGEEFALSQVSRGWDYAVLKYQSESEEVIETTRENRWRYEIGVRLFCDCQGFGLSGKREDKIFWEPVRDQPKIRDFDGLRFMYEYSWFRNGRFKTQVEVKTGTSDAEALSTVSGKFSLSVNISNTWLTAFYFNGYGKEPSTYHIRTNYFGIGFALR